MNTSFDESYDVVVAGFGLAGGIAALNAAQAGAKTLLVEKSPVPGGLSICSYGAVRSARDPEQAFNYLKATNAGRTPDDVLRVLASGMCELERYVRNLGKINNAVIANSVEENALREKSGDPYRRQIRANYPLPGTDTFYHTTVIDIPDFDVKKHYPWANGAPGGPKLFKIVHDHLGKHGVVCARIALKQKNLRLPTNRAWAMTIPLPECGCSYVILQPLCVSKLDSRNISDEGDDEVSL